MERIKECELIEKVSETRGSIIFRSRKPENKGTKFIITLPKKK